ncbi:hypothetical protein GCM10010193_39650 [Kitasatospora atroaurantiaca]|uniref:hypothetical protein n=1 Tax=Kitasatospora atroaurantiaca TaxID=285545 RepID=UPI001478D8AF|nr:hypothetical protein [Kitasatospora atroaurantiaca]
MSFLRSAHGIDGTVIERETIAKIEDDFPAAPAVVRTVVAGLGITEADLTSGL